MAQDRKYRAPNEDLMCYSVVIDVARQEAKCYMSKCHIYMCVCFKQVLLNNKVRKINGIV